MIPVTKWVERSFPSDLPVAMFPNYVERLRGTPARIKDRITSWPHDVLTRRIGESWSIQEHIGHLLDLEALWLGRLDDYEAGRAELRAADMTNRQTYDANHNKADIDYIMLQFHRKRQEFVERLEHYDADFVRRVALHPRLKQPMNVVDLIFFVAEHDDHHLARIAEIKFAITH